MMYIEPLITENEIKMKKYTFDEALEKSLEYFAGDELAAKVWVNKYALKDSAGNIFELYPDDMHKRLAKEIYRIEKKYPLEISEENIYAVLKNFKYIIPQGGPMTGIGNKNQIASLSNCFVIGDRNPADSYGGILKIDQEQVQLMKRRGGVGHDLSHIRPNGSKVLNSALTSTGIVPFMERYSNSTREVAQDGRRGALMLSVSVKHPDVEDFIDAKLEKDKVTGANISVKLDDKFIEAAIKQSTYTLQYPVDSDNPKVTKTIEAKKLWDKIIQNAWQSAEPGILFWDTIIKESVPDCYSDEGYKTVSTNPCGEIPLCPYDSCRLLAINLYSYVDNPYTEEAKFNFQLFKNHIAYSQRIMDDIIDLELEKIDAILEKINNDSEEEIVKSTERRLWENIRAKAMEGRRMGIGITAEGDMLAALGLQYGSENAIDFSVEVQKTLALEAYRSSVNLAKERGAFAIYNSEKEKDNPFINRLKEADNQLYEDMVKFGRRNIALLTIAPTGTTSIMTQTTSGIEPVFKVTYKRRRKVNPNDKSVKVIFTDEKGDSWEEYNVFHHKFINWLEIHNYDVKKTLELPDLELEKIIEKSPYYKSTSQDVDWVSKVRMQGGMQKWVDHSISVTVNLPEETSKEVISNVFETAWKSGCKGITVYREGSRDGILVSNEKKPKNEPAFTKRPKELEAEVIRFKNNNENWIAFVGLINGRPYEIFTGLSNEDSLLLPKSVTKGKIVKVKNAIKGKSRYDFQYVDKYGYESKLGGLSHMFNKEYWNYAKLISSVLRHGMKIQYVVDLISSLELDSQSINSWKNGVERALKKYIPNGISPKKGTKCENCGSEFLKYQEGCLICTGCGWSKCG